MLISKKLREKSLIKINIFNGPKGVNYKNKCFFHNVRYFSVILRPFLKEKCLKKNFSFTEKICFWTKIMNKKFYQYFFRNKLKITKNMIPISNKILTLFFEKIALEPIS